MKSLEKCGNDLRLQLMVAAMGPPGICNNESKQSKPDTRGLRTRGQLSIKLVYTKF